MPRIIDLHCDTIMYCVEGAPTLRGPFSKGNEDLYSLDNHINIQKLAKGGCLAQVFAIYIPRDSVFPGFEMQPYPYYKRAVKRYNELMEQNAAFIRPALSASDILANDKAGFMSSVLSVEDGDPLDEKVERLSELYSDGVRMIGIMHSVNNCLGSPHSMDPEKQRMGLKPFGIEVVREMERLGMVIDVSHMSDGSVWDTLKHTRGPIIASHSCCRTLNPISRNHGDDVIKAIGERGGVCGVNFSADLLKNGGEESLISDVIRHMDHIRNVGGVDMVAFGSDYDGISSVLEWKDYSGMPMIVKAMEEKFTESEIEKICHGNAMRVFKEVLK